MKCVGCKQERKGCKMIPWQVVSAGKTKRPAEEASRTVMRPFCLKCRNEMKATYECGWKAAGKSADSIAQQFPAPTK